MKLSINLYLRNGRTALATIEDGENGEASVVDMLSPRAACLRAAKSLREAAARFELLAKESDPYKSDVQDRVNRKRITVEKGAPDAN